MDLLVFALYLFVIYVVYRVFLHFWEKPLLSNLERRPVFIIGCDTGFGHSLALRCLEEGMPVFAGCLTKQGTEELHSEAKHVGYKGTLTTLIVDVTNDESVTAAAKEVDEKSAKYGGLQGVVNNAGIAGGMGPDDWMILDDYKKVLEVNTFGMIRVAHNFKPLVKKTNGRIVNMVSAAGRVAVFGSGPYTVSKFAMEGYNDILRQEMRVFGVSVSVLEPGFFETPICQLTAFHNTFERMWNRLPDAVKEEYGEEYKQGLIDGSADIKFGSSSDLSPVIDAFFHALTAVHPRPRYVIGTNANVLVPLSFLPTRVADLILYLPMAVGLMKTPAAVKKQKKH